MNKGHIEIIGLDPRRWAVIHIPIGLFLSAWFMVIIFKDSGLDMDSIIFLILAPPCIILITMGIAWLQAMLVNVFIRFFGKGPILQVQRIVQNHHGDWKKLVD